MTGEEVCAALASLGHASVRAPRLLLVFAHQDDETIAVGGRMECLGESRFICVTDGAPQDETHRSRGFASPAEYTLARQQELAEVVRHARLPHDCILPLVIEGRRITDKQARTALLALTVALTDVFAQHQPDAVLTHPYEGGHPDHDACAFAVHSAVRRGGNAIPIVEAPFYHRGVNGLKTGEFAGGDAGVEATLLPWQVRNKQARFACFRSQAQTLARFPTASEHYRTAPNYDFSAPPHTGTLNYEHLGWGMTGAEFCALAVEAEQALGLSRAAKRTALPKQTRFPRVNREEPANRRLLRAQTSCLS